MNQQVTGLAPEPGSAEPDGVCRWGQPLRGRRVWLAAMPCAVPWSRRFVLHTLREWRLDAVADRALLLVSELVTNAVDASASRDRPEERRPMIALTLRRTDAGFSAEVWDSSPTLPALQEPDLTGERSRGLVLVDVLADSWGHRPAAGGKVVWCEVRATAIACWANAS